MGSNAEMHRRSIEEAYGSIWRDGLLEELEGRDMIGDIVFNVFFIILGSLEEASLEVFAFTVL